MFPLSPISLIALKVIGVAALLAALGFGVNRFDHSRQEIGYQRAVAEYKAKEAEDLKVAMAETKRLNAKVQEAQNEADKREATNRVLITRVNVLAGRLRHADENLNALVSRATREALAKATTAYAALFAECRDEYAEMGVVAAGHQSDVATLIAAWPEDS